MTKLKDKIMDDLTTFDVMLNLFLLNVPNYDQTQHTILGIDRFIDVPLSPDCLDGDGNSWEIRGTNSIGTLNISRNDANCMN